MNEQDLIDFRSNLMIWTYKEVGGKVIDILEYLDFTTGEIFTSKQVKVSSYDNKFMQQRYKVMSSLTKEQRELALFLLDFRNNACGFLVPVSDILGMYRTYSGQRLDHIKKKFEILITKGVLQDHYTPSQIFMINNKRRDTSSAKGDLTRAGIIFDIKMLKK